MASLIPKSHEDLLVQPVHGVLTTMMEGAIASADRLTQAYSNGAQQRFYGDVYPPEQQEKETRVLVKISPRRVTTDAIFS